MDVRRKEIRVVFLVGSDLSTGRFSLRAPHRPMAPAPPDLPQILPRSQNFLELFNPR